jgi:hypothetical protein
MAPMQTYGFNDGEFFIWHALSYLDMRKAENGACRTTSLSAEIIDAERSF